MNEEYKPLSARTQRLRSEIQKLIEDFEAETGLKITDRGIGIHRNVFTDVGVKIARISISVEQV